MAGWGTTLRLEGGKELDAALGRIDAKLRRQILKKAVAAGAKPIIKEARQRAPVATGLLKKSLGVKTKSYRGGATAVAVIGPRSVWGAKGTEVKWATRIKGKIGGAGGGSVTLQKQNPMYYGHLVEFGTAAHYTKYTRIGPVIVDLKHLVPAIPPRPFLRPAFDHNVRKANRIFADVIRRELKKSR